MSSHMSTVTSEDVVLASKLIAILTRRVQILRAQIAVYGTVAVPPHIVLDKEEAERDLARAHADLRRLRGDTPDSIAPYVGLATFQEQDTERFFGREMLTAELVAKLEQDASIVVLGPSGSGKSSLVLAGVLPALRQGAIEGSERWQYLIFKPGARPLDALAVAFTSLTDGNQLASALQLRRELAVDSHALLLAAELRLTQQPLSKLVLVVDQLEELWTQAPIEGDARSVFVAQQQRPFIQLLLTAATAKDSPLRIILTMRADFLHRAAEYADLARWMSSHLTIIGPMDQASLQHAIIAPADSAGCSFEPGLVDALVSAVQGQPGALPLLQYTLLELWRAREADGTLTWTAFRTLGGVEGALAARADIIIARHYASLDQQNLLRQVLLRLIQPGEGVADTRRRAFLHDLIPAGGAIDTIQALLKPLVDERLITTGRDTASGFDTVEVAHEALIRAWPTFRRWIDEAREDVRLQLQIEDAAKEWQTNSKAADFLWSGLRLANAVDWLERTQPQLNSRDRSFLDASRQLQQERTEAVEIARREREALLEARAAATTQAQESAAQAARARAAAEALFELSRHNADRALLLARSTVTAETSDAPQLVTRALRRVLEDMIPSRRIAQHKEDFRVMLMSPDGQRILTSCYDGTLTIWEVETGVRLHTVNGCVTRHATLTWTPNSQAVLFSSDDMLLQYWDAHSGDIRTVSTHPGPLQGLACSPDGRQMITGQSDGAVYIWDLATGQRLQTLLGHTENLELVAWSPDGYQIMAVGGTSVTLWFALTGQLLHRLKHSAQINAAAWSPDGRQILTGGRDSQAHLWYAVTGQRLRSFVGHSDWVRMVAWSPDSKLVLTGSGDKTARIWDTTTGDTLQVLIGHTDRLNPLTWSPDGCQVLTSSGDKTARVWNVATGQAQHVLAGHSNWVGMVAWHPDNRRILTASQDGTVRIWSPGQAQAVRILGEHTRTVQAVAWSPDGQWIVTGSHDRTFRIWDAVTGRPLHSFEGAQTQIEALALSPDGRQVLTGSYREPEKRESLTRTYPGAAHIWDTGTGQLLCSFEGHAQRVQAVAWSPDSRRILTGSYDKTARIWDVATGRSLVSLERHTDDIQSVAWSPDGQYVVSGSSDTTACIWEVTTGRIAQVLKGHTKRVSAVAWSPDGQYVVSGSWDWSLRIWSVATGSCVRILAGHTREVSSVAWSLDGRWIASGCHDGTARIWNIANGQTLHVLEGHLGAIASVAWSPDGRQIVTGSDDGTARVWIVDTGLMIAEITRRVCSFFDDDQISAEMPAWRGCEHELAAVADNLKVYDALRRG
jgi:WD40 repeat protein